jgi:putative ABC transport system ATP-binding protein
MGEVDVPVLRGISLDIHSGELTVILGASGSGKSTLLNIIGGIDRPTSGRILFEGREISAATDQQLTEYRRQSVGFVFQFYNLVPSLTARENVEVSTEIADQPMDPVAALQEVGLGDRVDHFPAQMSGGQQQRVAIARALAKNPRLMLCDEPTGALDHETSVKVLQLLQDLNARLGTTIVMITHAPPIAAMARQVIRIGSGRVQEIKINPNPKRADQLEW